MLVTLGGLLWGLFGAIVLFALWAMATADSFIDYEGSVK